MKKLFLLSFLCLYISVDAQNLQDAIRMSEWQSYSTARTAGVGGAFGALGADAGSMALNPASAAAYHTSELTFGFSSNKIWSDAELSAPDPKLAESAAKRRLKLENASLIIHSQPIGSSWKAANFAFGFGRTANFDQSIFFEGESKGSFTDRFLERANGKELSGLDNFEGGLAYDVGAIYGPDNQLYYSSDYQSNPNNLLDKSQSVTSRGGIYEMQFAYGLNYEEKWLFGLSIGVPFLNYSEDKFYREESIDAGSVLKKLEFDENLSTSGVGLNVKAGIVALMGKVLRLGASVHSPTFYSLKDDYYTELLYEYDEGNGLISNQDGSPDGYFKYRFRTPWRFSGSAGVILDLGKLKGFVDFDAEYTDYSTGSFNFTAYSNETADLDNQKDQNENIREQFKPSMTYRAGAELAYGKLRVRGGYSLAETAFAKDDFSDIIPTISFGAGYRAWSYYIDFAWLHSGSNYGYTPYELVEFENEPFVSIEKRKSSFILTVGTKF